METDCGFEAQVHPLLRNSSYHAGEMGRRFELADGYLRANYIFAVGAFHVTPVRRGVEHMKVSFSGQDAELSVVK